MISLSHLSPPPILSVILPVYNQENYLKETVESILNQSFKDFELLIMDDGSTDSSAMIIRQFELKDKRIKAYFGINGGKSFVTNQLVEKANSDWCVFLDADDVMLPERIEKQYRFHIANPFADASSCDCYYINEKGDMFGTQRYHGLSTIEDFKISSGKGLITCSYTGLMISKKVFIETGGLVSKFEPCEDFEFFNRLADRGYILLIIPVVLMKYRIHATAITVKKPLLVLEMVLFVEHCIQLRRSGKPEITFNEFEKMQTGKPWWKKLNRKRFAYSMIYFRNAGFSILSKKYGAFIWQITFSLVLSPAYVFKKVLNNLK